MNWAYIAGYFDGEGCLLFNVRQDKREQSQKGSHVDGWNIAPSLTVSSYDHQTLAEIKSYIDQFNHFRKRTFFNSTRIELRKARKGQTEHCTRYSIFGWHRIDYVIRELLPFSIAKKEQYLIFQDLHRNVIAPRPQGRIKIVDKEKFIEIMTYVDRINALKSRKRGKLNADYFRSLWGIS